MKITLTKSHIDNGMQRSSCACPIALAIREALPGRKVSVFEDVCAVGDAVIPLPQEAIRFIETFDRSARPWRIAAVSFELPLPGDRS